MALYKCIIIIIIIIIYFNMLSSCLLSTATNSVWLCERVKVN